MGRRSRIRRSRGSRSESEKRICLFWPVLMRAVTYSSAILQYRSRWSTLFGVYDLTRVLGTGIILDYGLNLCSDRRLYATMPHNTGLSQTTALG
jgi:hypothetical protein